MKYRRNVGQKVDSGMRRVHRVETYHIIDEPGGGFSYSAQVPRSAETRHKNEDRTRGSRSYTPGLCGTDICAFTVPMTRKKFPSVPKEEGQFVPSELGHPKEPDRRTRSLAERP
jgi:hypothetical protein